MSKQLHWLFLGLFAVALFVPELASATPSTDTPLGKTLCAVVGWFTGNTGKGIATLAIIIIGVGALLGKVSWGMAIIVGLGVAVIFGAATLVGNLSPGGSITAGC